MARTSGRVLNSAGETSLRWLSFRFADYKELARYSGDRGSKAGGKWSQSESHLV